MQQDKCYTIITGAGDYFAKLLAIECARQGMNLVLVAPPGCALECVTCFIHRNFKVDVLAFERDLSKESGCYDLHLDIIAKNLEVSILINIAGSKHTFATTLFTSLFINDPRKNAPPQILNVNFHTY